MLSKNFIFTALFFVFMLFFISCLENQTKNEYQQIDTIEATDSSNFTISLDEIETIKTPNFNFDGKWKLINKNDSLQKTEPLYLTFEGRKIYSTTNNSIFFEQFQNYEKGNPKDNYHVFAIYNKCPDDNGTYNKKGNFLVIGSGEDKLVCYEVISFQSDEFTIYDVAKGGELEFRRVK